MAARGQRQWKPWGFSRTRRNEGGTPCQCVAVEFEGLKIGKIYRERGMDGWAANALLEEVLGAEYEGYNLRETKEHIDRRIRHQKHEVRTRARELCG